MSLVGEVEHFPWGTVNDLTKVSPYMLQRVEIGLQLLVGVPLTVGTTFLLSSSKYEGYFRQVRLALPELDNRVIIGITVRHSSHLFANFTSSYSTLSMQDIFDAVVCDANGNRMIGTQVTLFQSFLVPDSNGPFQFMVQKRRLQNRLR